MTSKQIEDIAVNKIQEYFTYSDILSPYVTNNDKEPCWDGHIYIYNDINKTSSDLYGRIPVQVKGKSCKVLDNKEFITYSVNLTNLENYKRDGGIIYFVVLIKERESIIYCAKLAPLDLQSYIKRCGGNKSIKIKLNPLSKYDIKIDNEFRDFYTNCKKQTGNINNIIAIDEVAQNFDKLKFKFFFSGINPQKDNIAEYLASHPVYLYADIPNQFNIENLFPIGDGPVQMKMLETIQSDISINEKVYYNIFKREFLPNGNCNIYIGNCLKINFIKDKNIVNAKVDFKFNAKQLHGWIKEAEFAMDLLVYAKFEIDGLTLNLSKEVYPKFEKWCKDRLSFLKKVAKVFDILNVNIELDIQQLNENDEKSLKMLVDAFYYNKEVSLKEKLPPLFTIEVANVCLALSCDSTPSGKYRFHNYCDISAPIYYTDTETKLPLETSIYSWFQKAGFVKVSNIVYSDILPSYKRICEKNSKIYGRANNDMLMMLLAYDETNNKNLLLESKGICEWLISNNSAEYIYRINLFQIKKRQSELIQNDRYEILSILQNADDNMIKVACSLLLDNTEQAEFYFEQLNDNEKAFFETLPLSIYKKNRECASELPYH